VDAAYDVLCYRDRVMTTETRFLRSERSERLEGLRCRSEV
jgi:hypothetical protein